MSESDLPVVEFHPYRWGNPATPGELPESASSALKALGVHEPSAGPADPGDVPLPEVTLPGKARDAIEAVVGAEHLTSDQAARVAHTRGWSTPDLLKLRAGDATDAPDAVVFPGTHDEVVEILRLCSDHGVAVVPFSGGTSVVGGLVAAREGFAGVLSLDLRRLNKLVELDDVSRTATLEAGLRGPDAERLLGERGFTLGHFPQSYEGAGIGGYAAARSAGQASAGFGRFDEMVVGLTLATPRGTVTLGSAPMSAAGPDLRQLVLGSEGALGVITSVTVRVRPAAAERVYEGWKFGSFAEGATALRKLVQDGPVPTLVRLSDEAETAINLADPTGSLGSGPGGCLAVTGYEGTAEEVAALRQGTTDLLSALGAQALGTEPGEAWRKGRYRGPYLRDPLLDKGVLVETLETVTFWSKLESLKAAVTRALTSALTEQGTPPIVLCHISHLYETGASLYFTVVCAQAEEPLAQWARAKAAANAAIRAQGAAISHHHGVGTDHRDTYAEEIGPLAMDALRAAKYALDPEGIMNPGVLIPPANEQ